MKGFFTPSAVHSQVQSMVPRCGSCGLFKTCNSPKMKPYGKGKRRILVVGEAPGATEDEEGRPFVGKAGRLLRNVLEDLGHNLDRDAWTTNSLICRPPKNRTPDIKEIGYCRPNLLNAIATFEPNVIVTLGKSALVSVMEKYWRGDIGALERWVGWRIPMGKFWICPTYHPSFLLRMRNELMDRQFSDHLALAFDLDSEPPEREDYASQVELIYDDEEAARALRNFDRKGGWIAVDYETNCIKPEWPSAQIYSCSVSDGTRTIAYPWNGRTWHATGALLRSDRTRKIASNLKFEERWTLKAFKHGVTNWGWDTMLAAHCLDNRQGICSIKFQALVLLGVPTYNEHVEPFLFSSTGPYNRIQEVDLRELLTYNGLDSLLEYKVAMMQRKLMGYEG